MSRSFTAPSRPVALAACAAVLLTAAAGSAGWPPPGMKSHTPWEHQQEYVGYKEPRRPAGMRPPAVIAATPKKYTVNITVVSKGVQFDEPGTALVMAHVPEDALVWFQDSPTRLTGPVRHFYSPALTPDKEYLYTARVAWVEDGKWVAQTHTFPIHAGDAHCIDILPNTAEAVEKEVRAGLAKLSDEDRALAEKQGFCAVQDGTRLGAMGAPVKVTLDGTPVFLCCKGCVAKAKADAEETIRKAKAPKGGKPADE